MDLLKDAWACSYLSSCAWCFDWAGLLKVGLIASASMTALGLSLAGVPPFMHGMEVYKPTHGSETTAKKGSWKHLWPALFNVFPDNC